MIPAEFTLSGAILAEKENTLEQWTYAYLAGVGKNPRLARYVEQYQPLSSELRQVPLQRLRRIMGPEPDMLFSESNEKWEKRIGDLMTAFQKGASFAPLIVTNFWEPYQISDGNHRQEALRRLGIKEYWVIFLNTKVKETAALSR